MVWSREVVADLDEAEPDFTGGVDAKEMLYVLFEDCLLGKKIRDYQPYLVCSLLINSSPAESMQQCTLRCRYPTLIQG